MRLETTRSDQGAGGPAHHAGPGAARSLLHGPFVHEPTGATPVDPPMHARVPWFVGLLIVALAAYALWPQDGPLPDGLRIAEPGAGGEAAGLRAAAGPALAAHGRARAPAGSSDVAPESAAPAPGLPLRVRIVEAESGRAVGLPWRLRLPEKPGGDGLAPTGELRRAASRPTPLAAGETGTLGIDLGAEPLEDFVVWDERAWSVPVSIYATALEVVYPLRAEARVSVVARDHEGRAVTRFAVEGFRIGGRHSQGKTRAEPSADGRRLRGVPFFRAQPLEVLAVRTRGPSSEVDIEEECIEVWEEDVDVEEEACVVEEVPTWYAGGTVGRGRLGATPYVPTRVVVRFPMDPDEGVEWGGSATSWFRSRCGGARLARPKGRLQLRVLRRDGSPAAGARVAVRGSERRADAQGLVRYDDIDAGTWTAEIREPGLVRTTMDVVVTADALARETLREDEGGTLVVRVLAHDGQPAPFATVALPKKARWIDLQDGVQRLDAFTDEHGERELAHVPAGEQTVTARWAGRKASAKVELREGARAYATITLPKPD